MVVEADSFSLQPSGPSLTLRLQPGKSVGIFGPPASGKSRFLRALVGLERPPRGSVKATSSRSLAEVGATSRRTTPLAIAKKAAGNAGATRVAEALSATKLWDVRRSTYADLSPAQRRACEALAPLASTAKLLVFDETLDGLDLWSNESVIDLIGARLRDGASVALATHRPEWAPRVNTLVALRDKRIVFAGPYADLERAFPMSQIVVETHNQPGVRALVAPFEVDITQNETGDLTIRAREGQKIAAKLLSEGYGDVRAITQRRPTPAEALRALITK